MGVGRAAAAGHHPQALRPPARVSPAVGAEGAARRRLGIYPPPAAVLALRNADQGFLRGLSASIQTRVRTGSEAV
ncbi:hypothetical protein ACS47_00085 [Bacillus cereus]|nr:hypothetical protein ACS47_00085 [Bacillus cereus]